jgi:tetratricopeptide (TPR) repeat protein
LKIKDEVNAKLEFENDLKQYPECNLALLGQAAENVQVGNNAQALQKLQQVWTRDAGFVQANLPVRFASLDADRWTSFNRYAVDAGNVDVSLIRVLTGQAKAAGLLKVSRKYDYSGAKTSYLEGHDGICMQELSKRQLYRNADALRLLATCAYLNGDYALASESSRKLLAMAPHSAEAFYWSIQANEKLAYQALDKFQQLEPNSARSHILLGDIYRQRQRYQDAVSEYNKALALAPDNQAAFLGLAYAYYGKSDFDRTMSVARKALQINPQDVELNLLMGESLISTHRYAEAEIFVKKSLQSKSQVLPHVHALLGIVYAETGRTQQAISELKQGLSSDEDGSYHYRLARLYIKMGDKKDSDIAMAQMKILQQQSRDQAAISLRESNYFQSSDKPETSQ